MSATDLEVMEELRQQAYWCWEEQVRMGIDRTDEPLRVQLRRLREKEAKGLARKRQKSRTKKRR